MDPISPILHFGVTVGCVVVSTLLTLFVTSKVRDIQTAQKKFSEDAQNALQAEARIDKYLADISNSFETLVSSHNQFVTDTTRNQELIARNQEILATNQTHITQGMERIVDRLLGIVQNVKE